VFNEALYTNLTDTIDTVFGWMLPNKAMTRATIEQCHLNLVMVDNKQNNLQKMFGMVDSSDSSSEEEEDTNEPHIDEKALKHKLEVLKSD
jgi:hypothetical protein